MSHPTISDIGGSGRDQEILSSITHIGPQYIDSDKFISTAQSFKWFTFPVFSKIFIKLNHKWSHNG